MEEDDDVLDADEVAQMEAANRRLRSERISRSLNLEEGEALAGHGPADFWHLNVACVYVLLHGSRLVREVLVLIYSEVHEAQESRPPRLATLIHALTHSLTHSSPNASATRTSTDSRGGQPSGAPGSSHAA